MSIAPIRTLKRSGGFQPFEQDFAYTGDIQTLTIPSNGLYKFEVWGAAGGYNGGRGGYSVGYKSLSKGETIYIVVGGQGGSTDGGAGDARSVTWCYGGYNGGGNGASAAIGSGAGGGATHIAKVTGTLASIGKASFDTNGLLVAGGGAGGGYRWQGDSMPGGSGGGTSGGNGSGTGPGTVGQGGTQSTGASFGNGGSAYVQGQDDSQFRQGACGGGGGYYGGTGGRSTGYGSEGGLLAGGGGSGYIGGVPEVTYKGETYTPSTSNGVQSGNGKAKITRIA